MNNTKSEKYFEKAQKYIPGGVNSPVRAFRCVTGNPLFIKRANGAYIYDEDDNEFVDYVCSWGPCILGHADRRIIDVVKAECENGLTFGAPTAKETELAEMICNAIPCAEQVRLVSSGTEAVMSAIRLARGYTGKNKIIKFKGNYHGHSDGLLVKAGSGLLTESVADSSGVPEGYVKNTLLADYNDEKSVERIFKNNDDIAALIVEPVAANMGVIPPKKSFLRFLRDICAKNNTILIFDEVITGFRLSYGGAGEYYGVMPDLVTLGKIVGGGMPLAAYAGRADIMQCVAPVGNVYQAGTLSGNPIAVTAGIQTLKILRENPDIYNKLDKNGAVLENVYKEKGINANRVGSLLSVFFTEDEVTDYSSAVKSDQNTFRKYFYQMLENGIYIAPSPFEAMFISVCHEEKEIEKTVSTIRHLKGII
ncbi:MAG: glutamate-1-semialdehyde 2,1-aminomutase [Clostridiales bacterium]|nr:glutamate-1-semialdehyde 2,1-aminomutase [Clostridiales bacterium]